MPKKEPTEKDISGNGRVPYELVGARAIERTIKSKQTKVDVREIANEFLGQWGGAKGMVERVIKDYDNCKAGSPERARMMEVAFKSIYAAFDKDNDTSQLDGLSDEELEIALYRQLGKVGVVFGLPIVGYPTHVCI